LRITRQLSKLRHFRLKETLDTADNSDGQLVINVATRFLQFGVPDVITFLLGWCAVSVVGTVIAVGLIRAGKHRQPEADDLPATEAVPVTTPVSYDR
jgi:hypothetical protein